MRGFTDMTDGVCLLGRYREKKDENDPVGCWLLHFGNEAAIVNMPPFRAGGQAPFKRAKEVADEMNAEVRYLLCAHHQPDHFAGETFLGFRRTFPDAIPYAYRSLRDEISHPRATFFGNEAIVELELGGEPLYLIHAPKHSWSDTFVVFRGTALTGDWELGTIRSVNDESAGRVPLADRRKSVDRLLKFAHEYQIHTLLSSRANDVRIDCDFSQVVGESVLDQDFGFGLPLDAIRD